TNKGDIDRAMALWQESLQLQERIGDVRGKAATLNNMALVIADKGDIDRAMALWQESLQLQERIGDVSGKATTLNNMALVIANKGDIDRAMALWQESLQLQERIGDVKGKAATLAGMAYLAGQQGNRPRQHQLNLEAARLLAKAQAYSDLCIVLSNLSATDSSNAYLAQSAWLSLHIQTPLSNLVAYLAALFQAVPQAHSLEPLIATTALFQCLTQGENHPEKEQLQQLAMQMMNAAASHCQIKTQAEFTNWMAIEELNDPSAFLPRLFTELKTLIGDTWLFDRTLFINPAPNSASSSNEP
ncbi:MAG: tetratricopeptide repeat protein, partial [Leptolyngbya sp. SIO4C5]|nr:tetratricopeptide repeat protein [Leptolyngbya sp. SIO4C5]